ncbi:MAG: WXG100 family type VII secretion target [Clostridiales bacterium]|nr:WXG100 family type VII secretion target [Clostridiales bacterium]
MASIDRINVSIEELSNTISKFSTAKEQLAAAYGQMATEVMALNSSWNGAASEAFVNRFSDLTNNIRTSDATMEQSIAGLKTAVEEYTRAEEEASSLLGSMTDASPFNG